MVLVSLQDGGANRPAGKRMSGAGEGRDELRVGAWEPCRCSRGGEGAANRRDSGQGDVGSNLSLLCGSLTAKALEKAGSSVCAR